MRVTATRRLSDEAWNRIEPLIAAVKPKRGRKASDDRAFVDGVVWMLRSGAPYRDLPADIAPWQTVYQRFARWARQGRWQQAYRLLKQTLRLTEPMGSLASLDSTSIRVHQHGAPKATAAQAQCVGLSRGGKTTKLHVLALCGRNESLFAERAALSEGHASDIRSVGFVLANIPAQVQSIAADRAYDADWFWGVPA